MYKDTQIHTVCPSKHNIMKDNLWSFKSLTASSTYFTSKIIITKSQHFPSPGISKILPLFCAINFTGDIKKKLISIFLNKTKTSNMYVCMFHETPCTSREFKKISSHSSITLITIVIREINLNHALA